MNKLQISVLVALPSSTEPFKKAPDVCGSLYTNPTYEDDARIDSVLRDFLSMDLCEVEMFVGVRRTPAGDAAVAALQDLEAV